MSKLKKPDTSNPKLIKEQCDNCQYRVSNTDTNNVPPSFSLKHIQKKYCLTKCTEKQQLAFLDSLLKRSQMTWRQIEQASKDGLGREIIPQNQINGGVPDVVKPDTKLIALRFDGKHPMVGYREGEIFHILWIDRNFTLYDHE